MQNINANKKIIINANLFDGLILFLNHLKNQLETLDYIKINIQLKFLNKLNNKL